MCCYCFVIYSEENLRFFSINTLSYLLVSNFMVITEISEQKAIEYWKRTLWFGHEVRPSSSIIYLSHPFEYDLSFHQENRTFLGLFTQVGVMCGINSFHKTNDTVRSRGLFVDPKFRGRGFGEKLLRETIERADSTVWSIPKRTALSTYLRSGFVQTSDFFETETSNENCYVEINKTKEHLEQQ